jgi:ATP-binding cassette subfamily F protein 3
VLAGIGEPASGKVSHGHNVRVGYLSQHADSAAGEGTVLEAVRRETGLTGQKARDLLGLFLFSGSDAEKQLSDISGGEQRRLSLAILVSSGANVLILDEPTNHLDIESREALEDALRAFEGAVILVSHDRALLEAVGSRTLAIADGELRSHLVGWATYQRELDERLAAEARAAESGRVSPNGAAGRGSKSRPASGGPSKNAQRRLAALERRIEAAERALGELESELADPAAWSSPGRAKRAGERHEAAKAEVDRLYAEWEAAQA